MYLRTKPLPLCLMLLSASAAFAASHPKPAPPGPSASSNILTCASETGCFERVVDGHTYKVIKVRNLEIMVSLSSEFQYTRADISIENTSKGQFRIVPSDFHVEVAAAPEPRRFDYIAPADLHPTLIPVAEPIPAKHHLKKTPPPPPPTPTLAPRDLPHLSAENLAPGQTLEGKVFFERDPAAPSVSIVLPISGAVFEFPFQPRQIPSATPPTPLPTPGQIETAASASPRNLP